MRGRKLSVHAGENFGRLTAVELRPSPYNNGSQCWLFRCDCGNEKVIAVSAVRRGDYRSCGCLKSERAEQWRRSRTGTRKPGRATPEYSVWSGMKSRCSNPNDSAWLRYGAKGVTVCERWRGSLTLFLQTWGRGHRPNTASTALIMTPGIVRITAAGPRHRNRQTIGGREPS